MPKPVRLERSGWRDIALNEEHRKWGWDCPAIDIDLLFLEYDKGKASALVEYKHEDAAEAHSSHPSYQALIHLANDRVPVFGVRYAGDFSWWRVSPLNALARTFVPKRTQMTKREWVTLLYKVRGLSLPASVFDEAVAI